MAEMITRGWRAEYDCKIILPFLLIRELLEEALVVGSIARRPAHMTSSLLSIRAHPCHHSCNRSSRLVCMKSRSIQEDNARERRSVFFSVQI